MEEKQTTGSAKFLCDRWRSSDEELWLSAHDKDGLARKFVVGIVILGFFYGDVWRRMDRDIYKDGWYGSLMI